jgi:hypothetical protein
MKSPYSLAASFVLAFLATSLLAVPAHSQTPAPAAAPGPAPAAQTIGGGTIDQPAIGPDPSYGLGGPGMILVKNWKFGTNGTIKNIADLNANFQYHDQFNTIHNQYGAKIVAPDAADALPGQPVEGVNTTGPVREFFPDSMKTYLVALNGAPEVHAAKVDAGSGSFQAKWKLPHGGKLLGQDIVWETRVRYVVPPYFWFSIWNAGNKWRKGAEIDLIESFGYDNGGGHTNYDGRYWHSAGPGSSTSISYKSWGNGMKQAGITHYDATQWHTWTWVYHVDDTYETYVDGIKVQSGVVHWTLSSIDGGEPIDMDFIFDGTWGHTQIGSVKKSLPASAFDGKFYEWDYSRIYLSKPGGNGPATTAASAPVP